MIIQQQMLNHTLSPGERTVGENWILGPKPLAPFPSSPQDMILPRPTMPSLPLHAPLSQPPLPLSLPPPSHLPGAQPDYRPVLSVLEAPSTLAASQHAIPRQKAEGPPNMLGTATRSSVRNILVYVHAKN